MKPYLGGVDDKAKDVAIPSQLDDDIYGLARASDIESTTPVADVFRDLRLNLCGSTSIWLVRSEFRRWSHGPFESVLEFRETLHLLGRQAYPALTASDLEETLLDQFINGVSDPDVRNPLLRELHTKFDDALRLTYQEGTLQAVCAPPLRGCVGVASMRSQADVDISTQILGVSALVGSILSDKPTGANRRPAALPVIKLDSLFREADFIPSSSETMGDPTIEDIVFREESVLEELKSLKECKSPGPDEIPAKLLFELAQELAKPLSFLCQKSFDAGILPTDWKTAHITPLYKSGSRALATNYRSVSLTSICCKVMEKTIKKELMAYLETNNLLSNAQYGFRREDHV
ncbi:hypothetical protein SprV_0100130800 [Sparganum proliferum]